MGDVGYDMLAREVEYLEEYGEVRLVSQTSTVGIRIYDINDKHDLDKQERF